MIVVVIFMLASGVEFRPIAILFPLIVLELYVFALALAFFLSALYVKYRDITYMWELGIQAAFYATPILYPMSLVLTKSSSLAKFMLLNPMAQIVQDARYILITPQTDTLTKLVHNQFTVAIPVLIVLATIVSAALYFRKGSKYFAENV
jgi:ABC-2 type transport system permease protein